MTQPQPLTTPLSGYRRKRLLDKSSPPEPWPLVKAECSRDKSTDTNDGVATSPQSRSAQEMRIKSRHGQQPRNAQQEQQQPATIDHNLKDLERQGRTSAHYVANLEIGKEVGLGCRVVPVREFSRGFVFFWHTEILAKSDCNLILEA